MQDGLIKAIAADSVTRHKGGGRLLIGGTPTAYFAETKGAVRLRILAASLPATLTRGLEVKETEKGVTVYVKSEAQAKKIRPLLERVAKDRVKAKVTQ